MAVMLSFSGTLCQSDPKLYSVLLVGQTSHLSQLKYDDIKMKFGSHVDNEVSVNHLSCYSINVAI